MPQWVFSAWKHVGVGVLCRLQCVCWAFMSREMPVISGAAREAPCLRVPVWWAHMHKHARTHTHRNQTLQRFNTHTFTAPSYVITICVGDLHLSHHGPLRYYNFYCHVCQVGKREATESLWQNYSKLIAYSISCDSCTVCDAVKRLTSVT